MRSRWLLVSSVALCLCAIGCGGLRLGSRRSTDLVVLAADPEDGRVGRANVTTAGRTVDLAQERTAVRVRAGEAPGPPVPISEAEIQRRFGAAMAARAPQPREFVLYFQTATDEPTVESQAALPEIVNFVRGRQVPDVSVVGHTDTTGDPVANYELGMQRARLIRDQLLAVGMPSALIDITSHGEADLLVTTADNIAEGRNRRVVVVVR